MHLSANKKGITLVASIMLIVFASIAVLGITTFIIQRLTYVEANRVKTASIILAEAGVQGAIYSYRLRDIPANGYFPLGQSNIDPDNYFVLGGEEVGLLMVDTSATSIGGSGNRRLQNLNIQNATNSDGITITRMIVTWDIGTQLRRINIDGWRAWRGRSSSPADCTVRSGGFDLDSVPSDYPVELRFRGNMTGATITIRFFMSDGTFKDVAAYPASNNFNFTVKSTGKVTGSGIFRTIQADYNALTSRITNYYEIDDEITP